MESLQAYRQEKIQPITKEELQKDHPQLNRLYVGKKGPVAFVSVAAKLAGQAVGSICKKETDTRLVPIRVSLTKTAECQLEGSAPGKGKID